MFSVGGLIRCVYCNERSFALVRFVNVIMFGVRRVSLTSCKVCGFVETFQHPERCFNAG